MVKKIIIVLLALAFLGASWAAVSFWLQIQEFEPDVYFHVPEDKSFVYEPDDFSGYGFEEYIKDKIITERAKLITKKQNFIDMDLQEMKAFLYKEGEVFKTFDIQSKGREGSWWETPPGAYFVGGRVLRHFSSVARVWFPYGLQFYGNFFIHGWPYDSLGRALRPGPSGGCIRLLTPDAAILYEFAERGMPVLIFDEKTPQVLPALMPVNKETVFPDLSGRFVMVAALDTGEIILAKEIYSEIYTDVATRGMFALAASELVSMDKSIIARSWMTETVKEGIIVPGRRYGPKELIGLILGQASEEAVLVLSRFFSQEFFVSAMNTKAKAIGMRDTKFVDMTGASKENTTTLFDAARMVRYINDYRGFIFNISDQWSGKGSQEKEAVFKVAELKHKEVGRSIFIGITDSEDAKADLEKIIIWLNNELDLK